MHKLRTLALAAGSVAAGCARPAADVAVLGSLRVAARDFAFEAPDTVLAGPVRLTFHNDGLSYHHVQILRLTGDVPYSVIPDSLSPTGELPGWLLPVGGAEGADSIARDVIVELSLPPGRYLLLCRITTPTGELHHALGMWRPLVVVGPSTLDASTIAADNTIRLSDYSIQGPDTLRGGSWRFRVINGGPHEHHVAVARLAEGRTLSDVIKEPPGATSVFDVLGGTAGLAPGQENVLELRLLPGRYVYLCFVPDAAKGLDHYQMGMVRGFAVVP